MKLAVRSVTLWTCSPEHVLFLIVACESEVVGVLRFRFGQCLEIELIPVLVCKSGYCVHFGLNSNAVWPAAVVFDDAVSQ